MRHDGVDEVEGESSGIEVVGDHDCADDATTAAADSEDHSSARNTQRSVLPNAVGEQKVDCAVEGGAHRCGVHEKRCVYFDDDWLGGWPGRGWG